MSQIDGRKMGSCNTGFVTIDLTFTRWRLKRWSRELPKVSAPLLSEEKHGLGTQLFVTADKVITSVSKDDGLQD
jgi:hypothetical protein